MSSILALFTIFSQDLSENVRKMIFLLMTKQWPYFLKSEKYLDWFITWHPKITPIFYTRG